MDINELRKEIDSIDKEIVKLFEKRMKIVRSAWSPATADAWSGRRRWA